MDSDIRSASLGDLADAICTASYLLGIVVGIEDAAEAIRRFAADQFLMGRDEQAAMLRRKSDEMLVDAGGRRREWEKQQKEERHSAFAELDRRDEKATT